MMKRIVFALMLVGICLAIDTSLIVNDPTSYYAHYNDMRNNYAKYALDLQSDSCASCIDFSNLAESMLFAVQTSNTTAEVIVVSSSKVNGIQKRELSNYTPIIVVANKTDVYRIYTDDKGKALYDFSYYCYPGTSVDYVFIYCPIVTGCGYVQCLESFGIDAGECGDFDQLPMGDPTAVVPTEEPQPPMGTLQPGVTTATYSTPLLNQSPSVPVFCLPLMLIFALLAGAMYVTGRNPFGMFDLSAPRLQKPFQYTARSRVTSISMTSIAQGVGSFASSAKNVKSADGKSGEKGKTVMIDGKPVQVGAGGMSLFSVGKMKDTYAGVKKVVNSKPMVKDAQTGKERKPTTSEWVKGAYAQTWQSMKASLFYSPKAGESPSKAGLFSFLSPLAYKKELNNSWGSAFGQSFINLIRSSSFGVFLNALDSVAGLFHGVKSNPYDAESGPKSIFDMILDSAAQKPKSEKEAIQRVEKAKSIVIINGYAVGLDERGNITCNTIYVGLSKEELPANIRDALSQAEQLAAKGKPLGKYFQLIGETVGKGGSPVTEYTYTRDGKTYVVGISKESNKVVSVELAVAPSSVLGADVRLKLDLASLPAWLKSMADGSVIEVGSKSITIKGNDGKLQELSYMMVESPDGGRKYQVFAGGPDGKAYVLTYDASAGKPSLEKVERSIDSFVPQLVANLGYDQAAVQSRLLSARATVEDAINGIRIAGGSSEVKDIVLKSEKDVLVVRGTDGQETAIDGRWIEVTDRKGNTFVLSARDIKVGDDGRVTVYDPATKEAIQLKGNKLDVFGQDGRRVTVDANSLALSENARLVPVDRMTGQEVHIGPTNLLEVVGNDGNTYRVSSNDLRLDFAGNLTIVDRSTGQVVLTTPDKFEFVDIDGNRQAISSKDLKLNPDGNISLVNRSTGQETILLSDRLNLVSPQTGKRFSVSGDEIRVSVDGHLYVTDPITKQDIQIDPKMEVAGMDGRRFAISNVGGNTVLNEVPKEGQQSREVFVLPYSGTSVRASDGNDYILKPTMAGGFVLADAKTGEGADLQGKELQIQYQGRLLSVTGTDRGAVLTLTEGEGKERKAYSSQLLESATLTRTDVPPQAQNLATIRTENGSLIVADAFNGRSLPTELGVETVTPDGRTIVFSNDSSGNVVARDKADGSEVLMLPQEGVEITHKGRTYVVSPTEYGNHLSIIDKETNAPLKADPVKPGEVLKFEGEVYATPDGKPLTLQLTNERGSPSIKLVDGDGNEIKFIGQGQMLNVVNRDFTIRYDLSAGGLVVVDNQSGVSMKYDDVHRTYTPLNKDSVPDMSIAMPAVPATVTNALLFERGQFEEASKALEQGISFKDESGVIQHATLDISGATRVTPAPTSAAPTQQSVPNVVNVDITKAPAEVQKAAKDKVEDFAEANYFLSQLQQQRNAVLYREQMEKAREYVDLESKDAQEYVRTLYKRALENGDMEAATALAAASYSTYKEFSQGMKDDMDRYTLAARETTDPTEKARLENAANACNHIRSTLTGIDYNDARMTEDLGAQRWSGWHAKYFSEQGSSFLSEAYGESYSNFFTVRRNAGDAIWKYVNFGQDSAQLTDPVLKALGGRDNILEFQTQNRLLNAQSQAHEIVAQNYQNIQRIIDASPTLTHESVDALRRCTANNLSATAMFVTGEMVYRSLESSPSSRDLSTEDRLRIGLIFGESTDQIRYEHNLATVSTEFVTDMKSDKYLKGVGMDWLRRLEEAHDSPSATPGSRTSIREYTDALSDLFRSEVNDKLEVKLRRAVYHQAVYYQAPEEDITDGSTPKKPALSIQENDTYALRAMGAGARAIARARQDNDSNMRALGSDAFDAGYELIYNPKTARPRAYDSEVPSTGRLVDISKAKDSLDKLGSYSEELDYRDQNSYYTAMWMKPSSPSKKIIEEEEQKRQKREEQSRKNAEDKRLQDEAESEAQRKAMVDSQANAERERLRKEREKRDKSKPM